MGILAIIFNLVNYLFPGIEEAQDYHSGSILSRFLKGEYESRYIFFNGFCKNKHVLDIGCGYGFGTNILSKDSRKVFGLDRNQEYLDVCKKRYPELIFVKGDAYGMPFKDGSFDVLIASEIIEHLDKPIEFLRECRRVLKKGGTLLLSTPNATVIQSFLGKDKTCFKYHKKEYTASEMNKMLTFIFNCIPSIYLLRDFSKAPKWRAYLCGFHAYFRLKPKVKKKIEGITGIYNIFVVKLMS